MKIKELKTASILIMLLVFMSGTINAQETAKYLEIKILTSTQCSMCKDKIEGVFAYEKGIKSCELDLETKILTVTYSPKKTDPDAIRKIISDLGYDADEVTANTEAYEKLPACCKKSDDPNYIPD